MYILKKDFQFTDNDSGTILILKADTKLEDKEGRNYIFKYNRKKFKIGDNIVENNPDFFEKVDITTKLISFLKTKNKKTVSTPKLAKELVEFFEDEYVPDNDVIESYIQQGKELIKTEDMKTILGYCVQLYKKTEDRTILKTLLDLGWSVNDSDEPFKK